MIALVNYPFNKNPIYIISTARLQNMSNVFKLAGVGGKIGSHFDGDSEFQTHKSTCFDACQGEYQADGHF